MTFIRGVLHFIDRFIWTQLCTCHFYLTFYHLCLVAAMDVASSGQLNFSVGQTLNRIGQQLSLNCLLQRQAVDCDRRIGLRIPRY